MPQKGEVLLEVKDMCKNFGVTVALNHVDFVVKRGEIRGLIGENGSGKSTVSSIAAGIQKATSGEMFYKGKPWNPASTLEAQSAGICMIVQEAGTIPDIPVADNIFLGHDFLVLHTIIHLDIYQAVLDDLLVVRYIIATYKYRISFPHLSYHQITLKV